MLVRTQILLEERQKLELEKLAALSGMSISEILRRSVPFAVKKIKIIGEKAKKKRTSAEALLTWAKGAVHGPGDSEYDKYAYGL